MKRRLLSISLVLALCLTCVPSALAVGNVRFSGGTGTVDAPYLIRKAEDLFALAEAVNSGTSYQGQYFRLTNDIDLETDADNPWIPIGNSVTTLGRQFLGSFDGGGNTVSGLYVYVTKTRLYNGLFGVVGFSNRTTTAEVKNLQVEGEVYATMAEPYSLYVGGITGFVGQGATITDCSFQGTVETTATDQAITSYTGGIAGYNYYGTISKCTVNYSTIIGTNENASSQSLVGGIAADNIEGTIEECKVTGGSVSTSGSMEVSSVGGIAGCSDGTLKGCSNSASVTGNNAFDLETKEEVALGSGGVVGCNYNLVESCSNTGSVTGNGLFTGGVVGYNTTNGTLDGTISASYNTGAVEGEQYVGGVVGDQQGGVVEQQKKGTCAYSHNYGAVSSSGQGTNIGGVFGYLGADASANVCYYLNTSASSFGVSDSTTVTNVESKTSDQFASGEVAFLLDEQNTASQVWGQEIGKDAYPVFTNDPSKNVLRVTFENTVDTPATTQYAYANPKGTVDVPEIAKQPAEGQVYCWMDTTKGTRYTDATPISNDVSLTVVSAYAAPANGSGYTLNYEAETAVAAAGHEISTDGATWHDAAKGPISIVPGQPLFVRTSSKENVYASEPTENTLPSRPASPDTVRGGTNQITGVTVAMEYRLSGASTWTACTGTAITGLPAGAYQVRIKATSTSFASEPVTVQVSQYTPPVVPTYPPTVEESENGTVTTSPSRPKEGDRVTITPKPDEGFEVDEVVVEDADGNEIKVTQNQDGTYSFTQPDGKVTITVTFRCDGGELCPSDHLTDVEEDGWYHDAVDYVVEHGIMEGMSPTTFAPRRELTRAEVVQVLYNLEGRPDVTGENIFTDTAKHWAVDPITWAATTGVVDGYGDNTFRPNNPVSRQEFAQMLYRYAKYKGYDLTAEGDLSQFPDSGKIGEWAEVAMKWANGEGLIQGHENGTIDPTGTTIRAQAASILMRFDLNLVQQ